MYWNKLINCPVYIVPTERLKKSIEENLKSIKNAFPNTSVNPKSLKKYYNS